MMYLTLTTRLAHFDWMHPDREETEVRILVSGIEQTQPLQLVLPDTSYEPVVPAEHLVEQTIMYLDQYIRDPWADDATRADARALRERIKEHEAEIRMGCIGVEISRVHERQRQLQEREGHLMRLLDELRKAEMPR